MNKYIDLIEAQYLKKDIPRFDVGDMVDVEIKIVEEGKNGLFFRKQHPDSIVRAVEAFLNSDFDRRAIERNAQKFSKENFKRKISEVIENHITFKS